MDPLNPNPQAMPLMNGALAWLNAPPAEDPLHELAPLRHHLRAIGGLSPRPAEELALLERFQQRTNIINAALKGLLNDATLPLDPHLRLIAQGLTDIHGLLATAILDAGSKLTEQEASDARLRLAMLGGWILRNLAEQQQVSLLAACGTPADLWRNAQAAHSLLAGCDPAECVAPEQLLKNMFALAAAQPETFAPHEIAFLIDYLNCIHPKVEIHRRPPGLLDTWYWLDENRSYPPMPVVRRRPPAAGKALFFNCTALADMAAAQLERLKAGEKSGSPGLSLIAASEDNQIALARAKAHWASPPKRRFQHRPSRYSVEICSEFDRLWELVRSGEPADTDRVPMPVTKWTVLNESPGGFAMMHVSGSLSGLVSGGALGLRTSPERPWNICLVRWARSANSEQIELGLQLIAPAASSAQVVRREGEVPTRISPAFLLQAQAEEEDREALLTTRARGAGKPFTLITEPQGKLQLTECMVQRFAIQTSSVEMLEFTRNFSPC
jgi:cyclic-di-GMP-binding protein